MVQPPLVKLDKTILSRDKIEARVRALGQSLARDLQGIMVGDPSAQILLVPILTGSIVFVADLIRHLPIKLRLGVVAVSSYPGESMASKGAHLKGELPRDLAGKHIVLIDDILDSGHTLNLLRDLIHEQRPASLRVAVLLRKLVPRDRDFQPDYIGFDIPDTFVVGYGLDYDGYYRNLPDIASLIPD